MSDKIAVINPASDSMVNFLTNSLTEASTMAGKSGPLSYNFCKNLIQIKQKKMLPATLVDTFLRPSYISRNKFFDTAFNNVLESACTLIPLHSHPPSAKPSKKQ